MLSIDLCLGLRGTYPPSGPSLNKFAVSVDGFSHIKIQHRTSTSNSIQLFLVIFCSLKSPANLIGFRGFWPIIRDPDFFQAGGVFKMLEDR